MNEDINAQKEAENMTQTNQNNVELGETIMPTMIDNEEIGHIDNVRDISAIIPQDQPTQNDNEGIDLISKEKELKSDGAIVIGTINDEQAVLMADANYPLQIDIAKRKEEIIKSKNKKKQKKQVDPNQLKKKNKTQNIISISALVVIVGLIVFFIYYKTKPTENDFKPVSMTIELGESLPVRITSYVTPGVGDTLNEMEYILDTSKVKVDKVGEYEFTIKHNNIIKTGFISIVDTTAPALEVREVVITEGSTYTPESFISNCEDLSGCNYAFENAEESSELKEAGNYNIKISATDAYDNKTTKEVSLIIEARGMVKYFDKENPYDFSKGYQLTSTYELHFTNFLSNAIILNGTYKEIYSFQEKDKYEDYKKEHYGEENYNFDDEKMIVTYLTEANTVGNYYSKLEDVKNYLITEGYTERV